MLNQELLGFLWGYQPWVDVFGNRFLLLRLRNRRYKLTHFCIGRVVPLRFEERSGFIGSNCKRIHLRTDLCGSLRFVPLPQKIQEVCIPGVGECVPFRLSHRTKLVKVKNVRINPLIERVGLWYRSCKLRTCCPLLPRVHSPGQGNVLPFAVLTNYEVAVDCAEVRSLGTRGQALPRQRLARYVFTNLHRAVDDRRRQDSSGGTRTNERCKRPLCVCRSKINFLVRSVLSNNCLRERLNVFACGVRGNALHPLQRSVRPRTESFEVRHHHRRVSQRVRWCSDRRCTVPGQQRT